MAGGINPFGFAVSAPQPAPRAPIDLPSAPFGFAPPPSKWEQTMDIVSPYVTRPINAWKSLRDTPLHILLGGGSQEEQDAAVGNSFEVAGATMLGGSVVPKQANSLNMGFRVFHGSPHDFPPVRLIEMADGTRLYQNMNELPDTPQGAKIIQEFPLGRFDMSKIGTGEGAQAYGHGLYFAEREGVAKSYRDALSPKNYLLNAPEPEIAQKYGQDVLDMFISHGGDPNELKDTISRLSDQNKRDLYDLGLSDVSQVKPQNDWGIEASLVTRADRLNRLQGLLASEDVKVDPGSMYEVNIDADPNAFLDWDKPLSEQPEAVRRLAGWTPEAEAQYRSAQSSDTDALLAALEGDAQYSPAKMPRPSEAIVPFSASGDELHQRMFHQARKELGGEGGAGVYQARVAEKLREAGIPGIKYLDAGSRGAGDGTRNYVVFDDNLISIVRKYGIAGASAMLGYNLLESVNPAQADELKRIEAGK